MRPKIPGLYVIKNKINKRFYIGSSIDISKRLTTHKRMLVQNKHDNAFLQNDFNQYSINDFLFELFIDMQGSSFEEIRDAEQFYLNEYFDNKINCYNIRKQVFDCEPGKQSSEETKKKISLALKGKKRSEQARKNMSGRKLSDEQKEIMKKANIGRKLTPEDIRKRQESRMRNKGYAISDETRQKLSQSLLGNTRRKDWFQKQIVKDNYENEVQPD